MYDNDSANEVSCERITTELSALRRLSEAESTRMRLELPVRLGALLTEAGGDSALELTMMSDDGAMVTTTLAAVARDINDATEIAVAMTDLVAPIAQLCDVRAVDKQTVTEWALAVDSHGEGFGFGIDATQSSRIVFPEGPLPSLDFLLTELSRTPHTGLRTTLRRTGEGFEWRLSILTRSGYPPLGVRAVVRQRFPGLRIVRTAGPGSWIGVGVGDLNRVLPIPVAGHHPLPGTFTGPAAPIPASRQQVVDAAEGGIRIGHAKTVSGQMVPVELSLQERVRHLHVLGRTGTGKSSALAALINQLAAAGTEGALVLDPHGHLIERVLAELPSDAIARTWVIRCGDVSNPVPLSPLAEADPVRRDIAIDATCSIFQELFGRKDSGVVGPRFRERVAMGMRALISLHGVEASLLDVPAVLAHPALMDDLTASTSDDRLREWWANEKLSRRSAEHGEVVSWVNSKFEAFASTAAVRGALGSGRDAIDFAAAMDEGRIILVDLSKAHLGEQASRLLGYLYLNRAWEGALRRRRTQQPFTVVVDEAQTLIAGALTTMLSEGRKFGLSVVLAHQYLGQLDAGLRPAIDGNVATTLAFRSAVADTAELFTRFGGQVDPAVLTTLPNLAAITLRTAGDVGVSPHTVMIDHNDRCTARSAQDAGSVTQLVHDATVAALVEPHRTLTTAAAAGKSRVAAAGSALHPRREPQRHERSFLDEWLANRHSATPSPKTPRQPRELDADPPSGTAAATSKSPTGTQPGGP